MILPIIVRACPSGAVPERGFAPGGEFRPARPCRGMTAERLRRLPRRRVCGREVAVATGARGRLLGLAGLPLAAAGPGLLIPRCASVHTFGMRFDLDVVFLDRDWRPLALRAGVPPRRLVWQRGAAAVLEIPSRQGGEFAAART
jgi:uncharacterized membrane protein (UPF0127 family)